MKRCSSESLAKTVKTRRKALKMTQEDLARAVNTTKATVSRWETGDIHKMKLPMVQEVCRVLQIDTMLFFQREEVLMPDEANVIDAYRNASEGIRQSVRILLGLKDESAKED